MKHLLTLGLLAAAVSAASQPTLPVAMSCSVEDAVDAGKISNLHGLWDFLMVPRGMPSFGLMSIGFVGASHGGTLAPTRTAPVVVRSIVLTGSRIHMAVASREGDVLFDGKLSAKGDLMCGTVTYHGGETFPMVAHRRPSTYQSPSPAQRSGQSPSRPASDRQS